MALSDLFVVVTNLQYEKQEGWQRRNRFWVHGRDMWLTVPVTGSRRQLIKEAKVDNSQNWCYNHQKTLQTAYAGYCSPKLLSCFLQLYNCHWSDLATLNLAFIRVIRELLGIRTPVVVDEETCGKKCELILNVCKKYRASTYLAGWGASNYMDKAHFDLFRQNQIEHQFVHKNLAEKYPYSSVHYLLTHGLRWTKERIK